MSAKITQDILESYVFCKYKGYLQWTGEDGSRRITRCSSRSRETKYDARLWPRCWHNTTKTGLYEGCS